VNQTEAIGVGGVSPADRILRVIQEFQVWDDGISARTMAVFLIVASKPGLRMKEVEERAGLGSSAVSRHIKMLSRTNWTAKSGPRMAKKEETNAGYDLVVVVEDPQDERQKRVILTTKGKIFLERLEQAIAGRLPALSVN
jgi:DNA-binding MarR family transcriptional regulator